MSLPNINPSDQGKSQVSPSPSQESNKPANPGVPETAEQKRSESDLNTVKDADANKEKGDANQTAINTGQKGLPANDQASKDSAAGNANIPKVSGAR